MSISYGTHACAAHANTGAAYLIALTALAADITLINGTWVTSYAGTYNGAAEALVIMTHTSGAQVALVGASTGAPLDPANSWDGTNGTLRLYMSIKPVNGLSFSIISDPKTDVTYCSAAGACLFQQISTEALQANNRKFAFVLDDTDPTGWLWYSTTPAGPPSVTSSTALFSGKSDGGSAFRASSLQTDDDYDGCLLVWQNGQMEFDDLDTGSVQGTDGTWMKLDDIEGTTSLNEQFLQVAYDPAQPWDTYTLSVTIKGYGRKGEISSNWLRFVDVFTIAGEPATLEGGDYLGLSMGMIWPWAIAWVPA